MWLYIMSRRTWNYSKSNKMTHATVVIMYITWVTVDLCACVAISRKNVLFLMVDDLRAHIGAYEDSFPSRFVHPRMYTPNIDKLASRSILFKRAYAQQALCTPSRASILTGRRPDTTHVYKVISLFREVGGNFTTLPQYFMQNGYASIGMGKVFGKKELLSWSKQYFSKEYFTDNGQDFEKDGLDTWLAVPDEDLVSKPLTDRKTAGYAIESLRKVAKTGDNFFMAVGFRKPHLPYIFPKSFMEKYYPASAIRLPNNPYVPVNMPYLAWNNCVERLQSYKDFNSFNLSNDVNTTIPDKKALDLRRAYYSAVAWIDSLVGEVLKELNDLGLHKNTIVAFVSDHGYHLGENGMWLKRTNFEIATRIPMMLHVPGLTDSGIQTDQLVEAVDLFQTLVEAAGLNKLPVCPKNSSNIELCTEGKSLMSLIQKPNSPLKSAAFSQHPRKSNMGYTIRTIRYRYTEWVTFKGKPIFEPNWSAVLSRELYDHVIDPEENVNRALDVNYKDVVRDLSVQLRQGWRSASSIQTDCYLGEVFYAACLFTILFFILVVGRSRRPCFRTLKWSFASIK